MRTHDYTPKFRIVDDNFCLKVYLDWRYYTVNSLYSAINNPEHKGLFLEMELGGLLFMSAYIGEGHLSTPYQVYPFYDLDKSIRNLISDTRKFFYEDEAGYIRF